MKISRRNFLKKTLAGSLLLGTASLPQPLSAMIPSVEEVTRKKTQKSSLNQLGWYLRGRFPPGEYTKLGRAACARSFVHRNACSDAFVHFA